MISREEALEKADAWINAGVPAEQRQEIGIYEFEYGYVVWAVEPEPVPPAVVPDTVGSASGVIDKETGELTSGSSLPAPVIAEKYAAKRRGRK